MQSDNADKKSQLLDRSFIRLYISSFITLCVISSLVLYSHARINNSHIKVMAARSQVINVLDRQSNVMARYRGMPAATAKEAEISGAQNRVRVEMMRYDKAVSEYNRKAGAIYGRIIIFFFGLPETFSLSHEITNWSAPL